MNDELKQRIIKAMNRTWDAIGSDAIALTIEYERRSWMKQDEVIEMVLDANRMDMYGDDAEALTEFNKLTYEQMIEIGKEAFPARRYTM